jgi:hypothetical protein
VLDAHAAHRAGVRRQPVRSRLRPVRAALGAAAVAAVVAAVAVGVRWLAPPEPVEPRVVATVRVGGTPVDGAVFAGSVYVADFGGGEVVAVDLRRRRVTSRIPVRGQPEFVSAAQDGGLWVRAHREAGGDLMRLLRIDANDGRTLVDVTVGPDGPMTVADGSVWAAVRAHSDDRPPEGLYRIDADSGQTLGRLALMSVDHLAASGGLVWALTSTGTLAQIDAARGRVVRRWPQVVTAAGVAAGAHGLTADAGGAWVLSTPESGDGEIVRVDSDGVGPRFAIAPSALPVLARAPDGLWFATADERSRRYRLSRLDAATGEITATVELAGHRPIALAVAGDSLWVIGGDGTLLVVRS